MVSSFLSFFLPRPFADPSSGSPSRSRLSGWGSSRMKTRGMSDSVDDDGFQHLVDDEKDEDELDEMDDTDEDDREMNVK